MTLVELAAVMAAVLMAGVIAFQVALAARLPLGEATMGGRAATVDNALSQMLQAPGDQDAERRQAQDRAEAAR